MNKTMKALVAMMLVLASMLSICSAGLAEEAPKSPYQNFVYELPKGYKKANDKAGTVTREDYTTYVYDENGVPGEAIEATMYVYTPYNYDPSKKYNILYLMHGGGDNQGFWFGEAEYAEGGEKYTKAQRKYTTAVLDNMIANGICGDVIVVTPTLYNNYNATNDLARFRYEMKNDIIPTIENKYATYAKGDVSVDNLIATRDHRAYAGLSMGSMTGFQAIWGGCIDYFAYLGNFSAWGSMGSEEDVVLAYAQQLVKEKTEDFADYDLKYWYNGTGTKDFARDGHVIGYAKMLEIGSSFLQEGEDLANGDNCIIVDLPDMGHAYNAWVIDLYNVLTVFFKAN